MNVCFCYIPIALHKIINKVPMTTLCHPKHSLYCIFSHPSLFCALRLVKNYLLPSTLTNIDMITRPMVAMIAGVKMIGYFMMYMVGFLKNIELGELLNCYNVAGNPFFKFNLCFCCAVGFYYL